MTYEVGDVIESPFAKQPPLWTILVEEKSGDAFQYCWDGWFIPGYSAAIPWSSVLGSVPLKIVWMLNE